MFFVSKVLFGFEVVIDKDFITPHVVDVVESFNEVNDKMRLEVLLVDVRVKKSFESEPYKVDLSLDLEKSTFESLKSIKGLVSILFSQESSSKTIAVPFYVKVKVERLGLSVKEDLPKGEEIFESAIQRVWYEPKGREFVVEAISEIQNMVLKKNVKKDSLLKKDDFKRPEIVHRGEVAFLYIIKNGIVLKAPVIPERSAVMGEEIRVKRQGEKKTIYAVVTGPNTMSLRK